jgi:Family of unknown function (DUF6982)
VKNQTLIQMLDGTVLRGTIETENENPAGIPDELLGDGQRFYFESLDGGHSGVIRTDSVKAIYVGTETDGEIEDGLRFFDSVPTPGMLWVRVAFLDGEVIEGMIANRWSSFCDSLIRLHLPSQSLGQKDILIPRTSISQFQVITTR